MPPADVSSSRHKEYWGFIYATARKSVWENKGISLTALTIVLLIAGVWFGVFKYIPEFSFPVGTFSLATEATSLEPSPSQELNQSVFDLAVQVQERDFTSQERAAYVAKTSGLHAVREHGTVLDIGTDGLTFLISGQGSTGAMAYIRCDFSGIWKQRLSLLKKGDEVKFSGTVQNYDLAGGLVVLGSCQLQ